LAIDSARTCLNPRITVPRRLPRSIAPLLLLPLLLALPAATTSAQQPSAAGWEQFDEEDGIKVFRRETAGSDIVALRGECTVDAPILRVGSVLIDYTRATEWIESLEEVRVLRHIGDRERVEWSHISTPFVLSDRDFVIRGKLDIDAPAKRVVLQSHSVADAKAPRTGYVRGQLIYGKFVLTSIDGGKRTRVLAEVQADPKGSVPKWLVNMFQKRWPHNSLTALRRQVKKPGVTDDPKLKKALADAGFAR